MKKDNKNRAPEIFSMCDGQGGTGIRELLAKIGDKWSVLIILSLSLLPKQRARFTEIEKAIPGISQRMLTTTLRSLERDGMVRREVFPVVPPRVEYELTELGRSLLPATRILVDWVVKNWEVVKKSRAKFGVK